MGSEERYGLALMLCDKVSGKRGGRGQRWWLTGFGWVAQEPESGHIRLEVVRLAGDLKAVAIEISEFFRHGRYFLRLVPMS